MSDYPNLADAISSMPSHVVPTARSVRRCVLTIETPGSLNVNDATELSVFTGGTRPLSLVLANAHNQTLSIELNASQNKQIRNVLTENQELPTDEAADTYVCPVCNFQHRPVGNLCPYCEPEHDNGPDVHIEDAYADLLDRYATTRIQHDEYSGKLDRLWDAALGDDIRDVREILGISDTDDYPTDEQVERAARAHHQSYNGRLTRDFPLVPIKQWDELEDQHAGYIEDMRHALNAALTNPRQQQANDGDHR